VAKDWNKCHIQQSAYKILARCQEICDMQSKYSQAQETQCASMEDIPANDFSADGLKKAFLCGIEDQRDSAISSYDFFNLRMSPAAGWTKQQLHEILTWENASATTPDDGTGHMSGSLRVRGRMPKFALAIQQASGDGKAEIERVADHTPQVFGAPYLMKMEGGFLKVQDRSDWNDDENCTMSIKYNVTRCQTRQTDNGPVLDMVQSSVVSQLDEELPSGQKMPAGCAKWFVRADATLRMVFAQKRLSVQCADAV